MCLDNLVKNFCADQHNFFSLLTTLTRVRYHEKAFIMQATNRPTNGNGLQDDDDDDNLFSDCLR